MAGAPARPANSVGGTGLAPVRAERFRAALEYAIAGDLRFLSHHDELRMLTRALARAKWPLAYTQGFNPRPRLTLALPRSLGTWSACQLALVELREPRSPAVLFGSLAGVLPAGCRLRKVTAPLPPGTPHAQRATYEVELEAADAARIAARIGEVMAQASVVVQREGGPDKPSRPYEIRPYIVNLELDGRVLRMVLHVTQQGSARPSEILTAFGLAAEEYNHQLRRAAVQWDMELAGPIAGPAAHERKPLEQKTHPEEVEKSVQDGH